MRFILAILIVFFSTNCFAFWTKGTDTAPEVQTFCKRVLDDGGTVIDIEYMDKTVKLLKQLGVWGNVKFLGDANFAVKKDVANAVSKLYDLSGNNNDAVQATGANQPIWTANQQSGKYGLVFDGNKFLVVPPAARPTQNCTLMSVFKATRTTASKNICSHAYFLGSIVTSVFSSSHATYPNKFNFVLNDTQLYSTVDADQTTKLSSSWYDSSNEYVTINGADQQSVANTSGALVYHANDLFALGAARSTGESASLFVGPKMADIVFFTALTTAHRTAIETFINQYYQIY